MHNRRGAFLDLLWRARRAIVAARLIPTPENSSKMSPRTRSVERYIASGVVEVGTTLFREKCQTIGSLDKLTNEPTERKPENFSFTSIDFF